jgi:nitrate/nitrite-specific signal transduction histidine kinase
LANQQPNKRTVSEGKPGTDSVEGRLRELTHSLTERVKELNCLYTISRVFENEALSLEEMLQGVINSVPPAWQYPEITALVSE